jgi:hypothetical protein
MEESVAVVVLVDASDQPVLAALANDSAALKDVAAKVVIAK